MGARAHERHVSHQHIEKLRHFIDARATQETPDPGDAWIIAAGLGNVPVLQPLIIHRAELEAVETAIVEAFARLPEQDRPGRMQPD
jgi:hypothetical protein